MNSPLVQTSAAAAASLNITLTLQLKKLQKSDWKFAQWVCSFPSLLIPPLLMHVNAQFSFFAKGAFMWRKLKSWLCFFFF